MRPPPASSACDMPGGGFSWRCVLLPLQSNPENSVGVLSMAGRGVEVHVALTSDVGKILSLSHGIKIGGQVNIAGGIQVAQLALKHRQNKNQRQRIVVFVGSPIENDEKDLVKIFNQLFEHFELPILEIGLIYF